MDTEHVAVMAHASAYLRTREHTVKSALVQVNALSTAT